MNPLIPGYTWVRNEYQHSLECAYFLLKYSVAVFKSNRADQKWQNGPNYLSLNHRFGYSFSCNWAQCEFQVWYTTSCCKSKGTYAFMIASIGHPTDLQTLSLLDSRIRDLEQSIPEALEFARAAISQANVESNRKQLGYAHLRIFRQNDFLNYCSIVTASQSPWPPFSVWNRPSTIATSRRWPPAKSTRTLGTSSTGTVSASSGSSKVSLTTPGSPAERGTFSLQRKPTGFCGAFSPWPIRSLRRGRTLTKPSLPWTRRGETQQVS